jgi:uncharacterized protein related to proFAR isomerase
MVGLNMMSLDLVGLDVDKLGLDMMDMVLLGLDMVGLHSGPDYERLHVAGKRS